MGEFNFILPAELHKRLKLAAVRRDEYMEDIVLRAIEKELKKMGDSGIGK